MSLISLVSGPLGLRSIVKPQLVSVWPLQRLNSSVRLALQHNHQPRTQFMAHMKQFQTMRSFHTTAELLRYKFNSPPRFNRGTPSTFGFLYYLIPDSLKAFFLIMGVSAFFLFFMGPLLIITVPPLVIGGLLLSRWGSYRRSTDLKRRYQNLLETHLTYKGSEMDELRLGDFVADRIMQGVKVNEDGLAEKLGLKSSRSNELRSHHSLDSRLALTGIESIDQDFQVGSTLGIREQITVVSFGLLDTDKDYRRVATIVVTLRPRTVRTLMDIDSNNTHDAVIEVHPVAIGRSTVVLTDENDFHEPPTINIKPNRASRY